MSDIIKLLPDSVANQIAAGEVIQRPSSVIKELVENALDAGATKVQIKVIEAGKDSIQVVDNGKGMSDTDARLAFERHATSKITEATDLFALRTMGFRGEALASIAAVAQVELRTRQAENDLGTSLVIEGSHVKEQIPVTCPVGANFLVRNLFFNIPARRKFLKSNQTELNHILSEFERIALAHPEVEFSLYSGESLLQQLPTGGFKKRILDLFGKRMDAQLVPIQVDTELVQISGFVGTPQGSKKKGAQQFFFVNGRYMRHPYFNKALQTAYERLIADGTQVSYFVNFQIDPARIDVNIHPQKTEIKFQDEQAIWPILLAGVREALGKHDAIPALDFDTAGKPDIPTFTGDFTNLQMPQVHVNQDFNPFEDSDSPTYKSSAHSSVPAKGTGSSSQGGSSSYSSHQQAAPAGWEDLYAELTAPAAAKDGSSPEANALSAAPIAPSQEEAAPPTLYADLPAADQSAWTQGEMQCLQHHGRYIIVSTADGLLIVDQHRAHIRVLYDIYKRQLAERRGFTQGLLFPALIQLSPTAAHMLDQLTEELTGIGFDLSPLGGGSYSILGIPAGTEGLDPATLLQSLVDDALHGQVEVKEQIHHIIAASLARRAAMPIGQALSDTEMQDLLIRLFATDTPYFTPEGQPTMANLSNEKIGKILC